MDKKNATLDTYIQKEINYLSGLKNLYHVQNI